MVNPHPFRDAAGVAQGLDAATGVVVADHARVVGDGEQQWSGVEVAGLGSGVDLQRRLARVVHIERVAVVDHAFEDGQGGDAHAAANCCQHCRVRVAFVPDLMDRSKLDGITGLVVVNSAEAIGLIAGLGPGDVVAVDLSRAGALDAASRAAARGATVYGFASHLDTDTMQAAKAAGIVAMARSAFFGRVADLFA